MNSFFNLRQEIYRNDFYVKNQISEKMQRIYTKSEHGWSYLGKIITLIRHLLNIAGKSCSLISLIGKDLPLKVKVITTRLKLFSVVGIPFSLVSLKNISKKMHKNYLLQDSNGMMLSSLSFAINSLDVLDSSATFVNTTLSILEKAPIQSLAAIGMPFGFAMSGLGLVSRGIQIKKIWQVNGSVQKVRKELKACLETNVSAKSDIAASLQPNVLQIIPGEIEKKLRKIYTLITTNTNWNDDKLSQVQQMLDDVQAALKKKFVIESLGSSANILIFSALYLFCIGSASSLPFLLLASAFSIRISSLVYQDL